MWFLSEKAKKILSAISFTMIIFGCGLAIHGCFVYNIKTSLIAIGLCCVSLIIDDYILRD